MVDIRLVLVTIFGAVLLTALTAFAIQALAERSNFAATPEPEFCGPATYPGTPCIVVVGPP